MKDAIRDKYKIKKHREYWERKNKTPLIGFSLGSYFISKRFNAVSDLLADKQIIKPDMINIDEFALDYINMHEKWSEVEHDIFFTGSPFPGLPWMEAMLGCEIYSTESSFIARSSELDIDNVKINKIVNRDWFDKYIEFTDDLLKLPIQKVKIYRGEEVENIKIPIRALLDLVN